MRLTDLDAHLISPPGRRGLGILFRCPARLTGCNVILWFALPVDEKRPIEHGGEFYLYRRDLSTRTVRDLTILDLIRERHWVGRVIAGEVLTEQ